MNKLFAKLREIQNLLLDIDIELWFNYFEFFHEVREDMGLFIIVELLVMKRLIAGLLAFTNQNVLIILVNRKSTITVRTETSNHKVIISLHLLGRELYHISNSFLTIVMHWVNISQTKTRIAKQETTRAASYRTASQVITILVFTLKVLPFHLNYLRIRN